MLKNEVDCGNFDHYIAELEPEGVLFGNAIEAPCIVWRFGIQTTDFSHPLPTPRTRIEERNYAKRPGSSQFERGAESIAGDHLRRVGVCRIEQKINRTEQFLLNPVSDSPVEKVAPLVAQTGRIMSVRDCQIEDFVPSLPLLDFPTGQIGINENVGIWINQRRASANNHRYPVSIAI